MNKQLTIQKNKNMNNTHRKIIIAIGVLGIIALGVMLVLQNYQVRIDKRISGKNNSRTLEVNRNNCLTDDCLRVQDLNYPAKEVSAEVKSALDEALIDEYKALSTYEKVIGKFGQVRPFSMIKGAEEQHVASLRAIYDKYGLEYPDNKWINNVTAPYTLQQACQTGVDAEIANAALYREKLIPVVNGYEDITLIFTNLMKASENKHLPAFDRCN